MKVDDTQGATQLVANDPSSLQKETQMKALLLVLTAATILVAANALAVPKSARSVTVYYSSSTRKYSIKQNVIDKDNGDEHAYFHVLGNSSPDTDATSQRRQSGANEMKASSTPRCGKYPARI